MLEKAKKLRLPKSMTIRIKSRMLLLLLASYIVAITIGIVEMFFIACLTTRVPNLTTNACESHYFVLLRLRGLRGVSSCQGWPLHCTKRVQMGLSKVTFIEGCPHVRGGLYRGVSSHQGWPL